MRLLIIDDENPFTELAGAYLKLQGFEVETCNEPLVALELLRSKPYDGVMLDLMMLPLDGLSILKRLREMPQHAKTPVFILSAKMLSAQERGEIQTLGGRFIAKPFRPSILVKTLREGLAHG